jgi:hypothetical protein
MSPADRSGCSAGTGRHDGPRSTALGRALRHGAILALGPRVVGAPHVARIEPLRRQAGQSTAAPPGPGAVCAARIDAEQLVIAAGRGTEASDRRPARTSAGCRCARRRS